MSAAPQNTGRTVYVQQRDATGALVWTAQPKQTVPLRPLRLATSATPEMVAQSFNQAQDELQKATTGARDSGNNTRVLYSGVQFTLGSNLSLPHQLGSVNVGVDLKNFRAIPGVAGIPQAAIFLDPARPTNALLIPFGTFLCDVEFYIAPAQAPGAASAIGAVPSFLAPLAGIGAVVSTGGVASTTNGTSGFVLTSNGPAAIPTFQAVAAGGGGWQNATLGVNGTLDFTLQASQSLATDGNYTIGGATLTKVNSANDATPMVLTLGTGVVVKPVASTQFFAGTRTAPMLLLDLAAIIPSFSATTEVEISAYWSAQNPTANFDEAFIGIDTGTVMPIAWRAGIAFNAAKGQQIVATFNGGGVGSVNQTASGNADVVEILTLPTGVGQVQGTLVSSATAYAAGVWPIGTFRCNTNAGGGGANNLPTSQSFLFAMGAQRQGSATAFSATLAAIRVRYKA